jgi:hypothetical protein
MTSTERLAETQLRFQAWLWAKRQGARQRPGSRAGFSAGAHRRLLLVSLPDPISQSQIFPFHFYRDKLRARWGYEVREIGLPVLLEDPSCAPQDADLVCFQAWIDKSPKELKDIAALLRRQHPRARLAFLDPCAPTDLRFATALGADVDFYIKKHALRDRSAYARPTRGDTNLSDWYGAHYGEQLPEVHFPLPDGFLDKLVVGPSFVTAPYMLPRFAAVSTPPSAGARRYDLHARLGGVGAKNWYEKMRADALARVQQLRGCTVTPQTYLNKRAYMRELGRSLICFSPFGYGEVCWRDYEAVYSGAVLLKPDMSHVETFPDVFVAHRTYQPLRWDFSDLGDAVDTLMSNPALRRELTQNAYRTLHDFARGDQFVDHLARVFSPEERDAAPRRARRADAYS